MFPVLSSCGGSSTIKINKPYADETGSGAYSDTFSVKEKQELNFELSYTIVQKIDNTKPGSTFVFTTKPIGICLISDDYEVSVTFNNEAMERYNGSLNDFVKLIESEPVKARNKFIAAKFESINKDERFAFIYLYHSYKHKNDKIKISLTSAINCEEVTAIFVDGVFN